MTLCSTISTVGLALAMAGASLAQPGTLDPSFNGGAPVVLSTGAWGMSPNGSGPRLNAVVFQSSGKAVAVGMSCQPNVGIGAVRFNLDGSIDASFGQGGTFAQPYTTSSGFVPPFQGVAGGALGAAVGPGDRIILMDSDFQFVCLTANGALDTTFGTGGKLSMYSLGRRYWTGAGAAVGFQADGKIIAAGSSKPQNGGSGAFTMARLNPNGSLDTTFANLGHGSTPGYLVDAVTGGLMTGGTLAVQPDGKILVAVIGDPYLARYLPSGAIDTSFGLNGERTYAGVAHGLALMSDGRIILKSKDPPNNTTIVARYTSAGALDASFGGSGSGSITLNTPQNTWPYGIAVQPDGSALLPLFWYESSTGDTADQAAFRLTPAGVPDATFGPFGNGLSQLVGWPGQYEGTRGLGIDLLGRVIMVGTHSDGSNFSVMVSALRGQ